LPFLVGTGPQGTLPPSAGSEDFTMEPLHRPAPLHELGREPVEQFGMAGAFAELAEVGGGGDEAAAEVVLPDPVDEDAGGEGVVRPRQRAGQGEAGGLRIGEVPAE